MDVKKNKAKYTHLKQNNYSNSPFKNRSAE